MQSTDAWELLTSMLNAARDALKAAAADIADSGAAAEGWEGGDFDDEEEEGGSGGGGGGGWHGRRAGAEEIEAAQAALSAVRGHVSAARLLTKHGLSICAR